MQKNVTGFTMIELMITLAIMAIIMAIAIPSYTDYVRRARRTDAIAGLQDIALQQAKYRSERPGYGGWADIGGDPDATFPNGIGKHYDWEIAVVAGPPASYTITATGVGDQASDKAQGNACSPLTLTDAGVKGPHATCWQ